ncbi:hypothetical protein NEOLEDRAFT_1151950 [Neolentinus lepideus HHB14362 ss-1]|uniref:Helicase ATP-binding domain-containing protein n=1 Tax=Neolentinus lepideus HHB14362 ss-1 TaxID=1314782 RepID=A0A165NCV7_9AGAM|nr:hypothetical protein NEOLEDRAFT_1151950 [Neolentinus lepideus HHB14362 ss-1]
MAVQGSDVEHVRSLLKNLRETPVDTHGASDSVLGVIYGYLMKVPQDGDGSLHWFCGRAEQVTIDAATFLIRLHAYNSSRVNAWKERLEMCMSFCCACVEAREIAKTSSRQSYLGAFSDDILRGFYHSVDEWETSIVLSSLTKRGIDVASIEFAPLTLADLPPGVVYLMLCNLAVFEDRRIQALVQGKIPSIPLLGWRLDVPPVGLLLLCVSDRVEVRCWAMQQLQRYKVDPILEDRFTKGYGKILYPIVSTLASSSSALVDAPPSPQSFTRLSIDSDSTKLSAQTFPFVKDANALWAGFAAIVRFFPAEVLSSSKYCSIDVRDVIIGHLHDTGPRFIDIFHCLSYLTERCGSNMWRGGKSDHPQRVVDAVKDNRSFVEIFKNQDMISRENWILKWFCKFVASIWETPAFGDVLAKVADFMCEELQHERFQDARCATLTAAMELLENNFSRGSEETKGSQWHALSDVLDIHVHRIVSVAFSHSYGDPKWRDARIASRSLVKRRLLSDSQHVAEVVTALCRYNRGAAANLPDALMMKQLIWKDVYKTLQPHDSDGIEIMLSVVSSSAHMDQLNKRAFAASWRKDPKLDVLLTDINKILSGFRDGFSETISRYADYNTSSSIRDLLHRQDIVKSITALMLCPMEQVALSAQTLVGQAFDVDVRMDCFRALLKNLPNASLQGIDAFLQKFIAYIPTVPEACNLSKSLVLCLTDIIEVLCSSDGLLRKDSFLRGENGIGISSDLLKLWKSMARALALIFKLTPSWAPHFENEEMTIWMRDALIFGRDMLAQWRVFEAGALTSSNSRQQSFRPSKRLSSTGKTMMDDLQDVLLELTRWLRLTDEELLHQSFHLLQTLLESFHDTGVSPSEDIVKKLNKFVGDARRKDPTRPQTRLDTNRVSKLAEAISALDDEVQIMAYKPSPAVKNSAKTPTSSQAKFDSNQEKRMKRPGMTDRRNSSQTSNVKASSLFPRDVSSPRDAVVSNDEISPRVSLVTSASINRPIQGSKSEASSTRNSVSESSSSSDEDSEDQGTATKEGGLAALGKLQRTPRIKRTIERRQVKMLDMPTNGKSSSHRLIDPRREAQKTVLRLKPDISSLHKALLSWNYDHDGLEPPMRSKMTLNRVPDRFNDYGHYRTVFEPLLLFECWAQLVQSKQEPNQDNVACRIVSRGFIDDWLDLDISITDNVKKDWVLTDTDIVVIRQPETKKCILGKTQSYKAMPYGIQATIRCYLPTPVTDPGLQINSDWRLSKVFSLRTLHREYAALVALPFYDFFDVILRPRLLSKPHLDAQEIRQAQEAYKVNEPQAIAILSSLKNEGFTLIQGPPGTGKTSTICGLVQAFLTRRARPATAIHAGRSAVPADKEPIKKALLCAPSNAAVDEIAHRLKDGVSGAGHGQRLKVVRVGNDKNVNISVKDITLDYLVEQMLNSGDSSGIKADTSDKIAALRVEIEAVKKQRQQKQDELHVIRDNAVRTLALEEEIRALNSRRMKLTQQFDRMKDQHKSDYRTMDATRRKCRSEIILEADVICGTLSSVGHDILEQCDFDMVIIDEAAQAIELSSLIPLKYKTKRCVMVGGHLQASKYFYNQSLFVRLQKENPESVHLLRLPSRLFYQGQLQDGPDMATKTSQPWHSHGKFGTYKFFSTVRGREEGGGYRSLINKAECQLAVSLYGRLRKEFSMVDFDFRVGVVSMYRAQIAEMRRTFIQRFGQDIVGKVDFNTVDGFQGQEKDVIILSCVRAGPGLQSIGFLSDTRRMNVALTRAKSSLFVLGHAPTLERSDANWRAIIEDAKSRSRLAEVDPSFFTTAGDSQPPSITAVLAKREAASISSIPPTPQDLSTPRQFIETPLQRQTQTATSSSQIPSCSAPGDSLDVQMPSDAGSTLPRKRSVDEGQTAPRRPPPALRPNNLSDSPAPVGQRRPSTEHLPKRPPPAAQHDNDVTKPKPRPPVKRPKPGPSLFIPKSTKR